LDEVSDASELINKYLKGALSVEILKEDLKDFIGNLVKNCIEESNEKIDYRKLSITYENI
jgi:hypothetical protein